MSKCLRRIKWPNKLSVSFSVTWNLTFIEENLIWKSNCLSCFRMFAVLSAVLHIGNIKFKKVCVTCLLFMFVYYCISNTIVLFGSSSFLKSELWNIFFQLFCWLFGFIYSGGIESFLIILRDCRQISFLTLIEFKRVNSLLLPLESSESLHSFQKALNPPPSTLKIDI